MSGLLDPQVPEIALLLLREVEYALELLAKLNSEKEVKCVVDDVGPCLHLPVPLRITLRIVQTRKLLSVAADYMTADHRMHEPESHL